jgi:hypothetical protein
MGNTAQTIAPTSETTEFNPQIDDIIEEAYERTGVLGTRTGYQLRSARRSLNILFQEWANRGVHLWKVKLAKIPLVQGQAEYSYATDSVNFPDDMTSILEAYYRNNSNTAAPSDVALTQISRSAYSATPNKLTQGTPSQYYMDRKLNPSIFLYATPSASISSTTTPSSFQFCFYYLAKIQDAGSYNYTSDDPRNTLFIADTSTVQIFPMPCLGRVYKYFQHRLLIPGMNLNLNLNFGFGNLPGAEF